MEKINKELVLKDFPYAVFILINGPRHLLMQNMYATEKKQSRTKVTHKFGNIMMFKAATINKHHTINKERYKKVKVIRTTLWRFAKGSQQHELINPEGEIFIMQSYAQIEDPKLTLSNLKTLEQRLKLPRGWRYRARVLEHDLDVEAKDEAFVLQDDLSNSYQMRTDCRAKE